MIRPAGLRGVAFGTAADGDGRRDPEARALISGALGITEQWALIDQVHGTGVARADRGGELGEADAAFTSIPGLPVAVGTADCVPVGIEGPDVAAVAHAGWRGTAAGVVPAALATMRDAELHPTRAAIGPSIGPCCYEVGDAVLAELGAFAATTTWGTASVDLWSAVEADLDGLSVWRADRCTRCDSDFHSHRRDGTSQRQVALAWLPNA